MQFIICSYYNYLYIIIYSYNKLLFRISFAQNILLLSVFFFLRFVLLFHGPFSTPKRFPDISLKTLECVLGLQKHCVPGLIYLSVFLAALLLIFYYNNTFF